MRLFSCLILVLSFSVGLPVATMANNQPVPFLKICDNSPKTLRRNCSGIEFLPVEISQTRLYAYLEIAWLSPNQAERSTRPLYLRWEFVPEGGKPVLLSNPNTHENYIWRPKPWNNVTFWDVNQRAYQDKRGFYRFTIFEDFSDWEGSIIEQAIVQIRPETN